MPNNKKKLATDDLTEYLRFMEEKNLHELEIKDGDFHVKLVRQTRHAEASWGGSPIAPANGGKAKVEKPVVEDGTPVKAPIAGVFYRARSPQSPAFVNVGDIVTSEQTMCIIEAMKVMNEIVAGASGRVAKILVENGKSIEAGQTLFILK